MKILENVVNIIKNKFNCELIYNKKYLKSEKKINTKRLFSLKEAIFICTNDVD